MWVVDTPFLIVTYTISVSFALLKHMTFFSSVLELFWHFGEVLAYYCYVSNLKVPATVVKGWLPYEPADDLEYFCLAYRSQLERYLTCQISPFGCFESINLKNCVCPLWSQPCQYPGIILQFPVFWHLLQFIFLRVSPIGDGRECFYNFSIESLFKFCLLLVLPLFFFPTFLYFRNLLKTFQVHYRNSLLLF